MRSVHDDDILPRLATPKYKVSSSDEWTETEMHDGRCWCKKASKMGDENKRTALLMDDMMRATGAYK